MGKFRLVLIAAAMTAAPALFSTTVAAATFGACSGDGVEGDGAWDVSTAIEGATDCTWRLDVNQDNTNVPLVVNEGDGFFGHDDWVFSGKLDSDGVGYAPDGDSEQGGLSGEFDITGIGELDGKIVMAVFKDGNAGNPNDPPFDGTDPVGLVGYILGSLSGEWDTPFIPEAINELFGPSINNAKETSHISIYYKEDPGTGPKIPLPAGMPLMLTAIGIGAYMKRRARKSA